MTIKPKSELPKAFVGDPKTILFRASKIVTFGSTVAMEAVYWRKPSVLLGKAFSYYLDGPIVPTSREAIIDLVFEDSAPVSVAPGKGFASGTLLSSMALVSIPLILLLK